jgi:hypothetical protein
LEKSGFADTKKAAGFRGPRLVSFMLFLKDTESGRPPEYYYEYPNDVNYQVIAAG